MMPPLAVAIEVTWEWLTVIGFATSIIGSWFVGQYRLNQFAEKLSDYQKQLSALQQSERHHSDRMIAVEAKLDAVVGALGRIEKIMIQQASLHAAEGNQ